MQLGMNAFGASVLALLMSGSSQAAPPAVEGLTPMTPDVVASYDLVRPGADFVKRVVLVPMRDGVKLYTVIVMKKGVTNAPMLLSRTPYSAKEATSRTKGQSILDVLPAMDAPFVESNYIPGDQWQGRRNRQQLLGLYDVDGGDQSAPSVESGRTSESDGRHLDRR